MAIKRTEREWADLDARYDVMKRQTGWDTAHMAEALGVKRQTLVDRLRLRLKQGALPDDVNPWVQSTPQVPDKEPGRYLEGTHQPLQNSGEPLGTDEVPKKSSEPSGAHGVPMRTSALEGPLPEPVSTLQGVDRRAESGRWSGSAHELLMMVSHQVDDHGGKLRALTDHIRMLEAQVSERFRVLESATQECVRHLQPVPLDRHSRVKPSLPEWMRTLQGIPGYPKEPHKDSRLNIHLPEEERWLINAIADGLDVNISSLVRRILAEWSQQDEAQTGLRAHLERRGIQESAM
jgi:hypothetical protein